MNRNATPDLEALLHTAASQFEYPPTPTSLASLVTERLQQSPRSIKPVSAGLAWAAALTLALFVLSMMFVPPVRAAVLDFLQIGTVRIFFDAPATALPATNPIIATPSLTTQLTQPAEASSQNNFKSLFSLEDLAGETTLEQAAQQANFPILAPSYPSWLGLPDHTYLQFFGGPEVILVWTQPNDPSKVAMTLQAFGPDTWGANKFQPQVLENTQVNGQPAVWAVGPYMLQLLDGSSDARRLVVGNALIWQQDGLTYRLESSLSLDEARKTAESLGPVEELFPSP